MDHILPYLFLLACPVSMGVMMWMMMRKDHGQASPPVSDPRVAELESQRQAQTRTEPGRFPRLEDGSVLGASNRMDRR